jgi:hypothetical protein
MWSASGRYLAITQQASTHVVYRNVHWNNDIHYQPHLLYYRESQPLRFIATVMLFLIIRFLDCEQARSVCNVIIAIRDAINISRLELQQLVASLEPPAVRGPSPVK